jgi:hypothetical protein
VEAWRSRALGAGVVLLGCHLKDQPVSGSIVH